MDAASVEPSSILVPAGGWLMWISLSVATLLLALPLQIPGEAPALPEKPPGVAGASPLDPAHVDLTADSMIFGPDEKQKNIDGKHVHGMIVSAAFSPDGKSLVTGDAEGMVKVFEPESGRHRISFRASDPYQDRCNALAISPDGRMIAVPAKGRGQVATMDPTSGRMVREMRTFLNEPRASSVQSSAQGLAFSRDGRILAGGLDWSGETLVWDVSSGRCLQVIPPQMLPGNRVSADVRGVAFSPDGSTLYISGYRLLMWDVRGARPRPSEWPGDAYAGDLTISRDGTRLAVVGAFQGRTRGFSELAVVEAATGRVLCSVDEGRREIIDAAFTPDGRTIVTVVWHGDGEERKNRRFILRLRETSTLRLVSTVWFGRELWIGSVAISPDGTTIAAGGCTASHPFGVIGMAEWDGTQIRPWRANP
jgi:WD40 repeat protein